MNGYLLRSVDRFADLSATADSLRRGDAVVSMQYDDTKEGRVLLVLDGSLASPLKGDVEADAIPMRTKYAPYRSVMRPPYTRLMVSVVDRANAGDHNLRVMDQQAHRLTFDVSGTVARHPWKLPMHRFVACLAGATAYATHPGAAVEPIDLPDGIARGAFTVTDSDFYCFEPFASEVYAVPNRLLEEAVLSRCRTLWERVLETSFSIAWISRPFTSGIVLGLMEGRGAGAVRGMFAQGFAMVREPHRRPRLEPVTDRLPCGGDDPHTVEGLACAADGQAVLLETHAYVASDDELPLPRRTPVSELDEAWKTFLLTMDRDRKR